MSKSALSVKQLNFYIKNLIEGDPRLQSVYVVGELSNLKSHYASGHFYFTLKDNDAAIGCVMFRSFASRIKFEPQDGMQVLIRGRVSVYERDGKYQIYAEDMRDAGFGDIALKFEQTKEKLQKEGLFDPHSKRKLPEFPKKIAVMTSSTGAAIRDIFNILSRRWPLAEVVMCPVSVQGELAVPEMLSSLDKLYTVEGVDLLIIGRGGGSAEDLWAFNDERLAYKIFESPFPVISAVGHETDFTICDFVADLRAPTPSAAAELAVPDREEMLLALKKQEANLLSLLKAKYETSKLRFEKLSRSRALTNPLATVISDRAEGIDRLSDKMVAALNEKINSLRLVLGKNAASLDALSPLKTLSRGYAVASKDGKTVQSVKELKPKDIFNIRFADGEATAQITEIKVN
ncbi:MAG: exodeoxyribonuclease VII large subunit [Clostridia bacterium]|nr:exodeoxyribonuclease VII large subunit [Clostridia bacterium]